MLKPEFFNNKSDKVEEYIREYEDFLLTKIAETLLKAGELGATADRYTFILQQMNKNNDEIVERLAKLTKLAQKEVRKLLQESVMTSFSNDKDVLKKYFNGDFGPLDNPVIREVMDAEWKKTCGELENLTRTTVSQYQQDLVDLLNSAEIRVTGGAQSYSSAVCEVLDEYAAAGMTVDYPTGAKRSLEAATRCAVVTSMNQTAAQVTNAYIAQGDIEYVLVSAHLGARHGKQGGLYSHDEWQGKPYKLRGSEPGYPNLLESTGYDIDPVTGKGTVVNPAGLHGYNCRHSHQPWDKSLRNPWVDEDGKPIIDPGESLEKYKQSQKQRAMERAIRRTKRKLVVKQAETDNLPAESMERATAMADYDALSYKLSQQDAEYKLYCAENDLQTQSERLKVAGFGKAEASKARGRARAFSNAKNK